ncbi:MAG: gamma-glutamylcyclotransferase [Paracoccaceae bacterium]
MATWIFGYGSLLWNPGFTPAETRRATLHGHVRHFCMLSWMHRGTRDAPGLVLALDREEGACTEGVALRIPEDGHDAILAEIRERELATAAYDEVQVTLETEGGALTAIAYVMDKGHPQYLVMGPDAQAGTIARARGGRGPNAEYLHRTVEALAELGILDDALADLDARVRALAE